eukprot:332956_1
MSIDNEINNINNINDDDNIGTNNISSAATQLLNAVCEILDNYTSRQNTDDFEEINRRNMDQRVVRFNIKPPPPPHSSRSNTKTRNSLPDLPLSPLSPIQYQIIPTHQSHIHFKRMQSIKTQHPQNTVIMPQYMTHQTQPQRISIENGILVNQSKISIGLPNIERRSTK